MKECYASAIPLGRLGRPEDVALTVLMLTLEAGNFDTGQVFRPNGGSD